jgi:hypothetical protein
VPLDRVRLTAAKSSLGRHRKLRLARPQGSGSTSTLDDGLHLARPQGSNTASASEDGLRLARPRARTQPRPRKTDSASPAQGSDSTSTSEDGLRLARPQGLDSTLTSEDGLRLARPRGQTQPRPRKTDSTSTSEESPPRPNSGPDRPRHRGAIITLPLASSGYGEQDRRPIWLAPVNK